MASYFETAVNNAAKAGDSSFETGLQGGQAERLAKLQALLKGQVADQDIARVKALKDQGMIQNGGSIKVGDVSVGADPAMKNSLANERLMQGKQENYSKRLEKINGFTSALKEAEDKTNADGNGGVVTNGNAQLMSTGKIASKLPTSLIGLGELVGAAPKGSSDERKTLERLQLEYQKAMSGMRTTDEMSKREQAAMGYIASGDPALVAKGVRSLARNVSNATKTIQAGYNPEVRARVHDVAGDPMDFFSKVYDDGPAAQSKTASAAAPAAQERSQANINKPSPQKPMTFEEFKARKASGQL